NGGAAWGRPSSVPPRSDTVLVGSLAYSAPGWVQDSTDPRGLVSRTGYDNLGRVTQAVENYVDGVPSNGDDKTVNFTYDGNGNVLTLTALLAGGGQEQTQYVRGVTGTINSNDLVKEVWHPDKSSGSASSSEKDSFSTPKCEPKALR